MYPSVALLAEGVDRNRSRTTRSPRNSQSPSSRRAWIEINDEKMHYCVNGGRPPRGGRG